MILITGSLGQLGQELCHLLDERRIPYVATHSVSLDITNKEHTMSYIKEVNPSIIYHCAAYTAVDKAEDEGKEINELVNVTGTENVALAAKEVGATLVYISTDYVFDGSLTDEEYSVDHPTNPLNEYGRGKLLGEQAVQRIMGEENHYIIRTSWVFGEYGANFVYTMKRLAKTMDKLSIVNDQYGRPTWTRTLAEFMMYATTEKINFGTYHLSNDNSCTWYEFAKEILKDEVDLTILPVTSEEFPQKATRPKHSIMDLSKTKATGFVIPTWQEALNHFLASDAIK
ncbi:dTDP-4-dehydrorhamnose reductase [Vagococcus fluvialis]|uniref:dTDP-4-dehydrorhamnose reductase n=1 Tax=Vagococcus fluvialis TaxID=2738 RepID=UPI001432A9A9|nr:dTDP-4-dehydrorhamnose reductase [Vagococcus fluvialis]NKC59713.1 dTDP-4-dehydrorhamnose reductase [Vagococcus fluvialis]NKD50610.1 dTDP-4-dehydrorhamnose reductase [Vagococcus fluvialis]